MATNATWTVIFDDKAIIKNYAEGAEEGAGYRIDDDAFWSQSKFSNIWAIQYGTSNPSDTVEYRDETPHSTWEDADLGDFSDFITRWDAAHLASMQADWDNNVLVESESPYNEISETEAEKIARIGERPTSYSSS
jgi:hypothetical protein